MILRKPKFRFGQKVWFNQFSNNRLCYPATILGILGLHGTDLVYEVAKHDAGISVRRWAFESQLIDANDDSLFSFNAKGIKDENGVWYVTRPGCDATVSTHLDRTSRGRNANIRKASHELE